MRRWIELSWGILLALVSVVVLGGLVYTYILRQAEPRYPWWWAMVVAVIWLTFLRIAVARIRGSRRRRNEERART